MIAGHGETIDTGAVRRWLGILHGDSPGHLQIAHTGDWSGKVFPTADLDAAAAYVARLDAERHEGIYLRITSLTAPPEPGKRGGVADSAALPALWADIDIAGPGHAEHDLPPDEAAGRRIVADSGLPDPTIWIHSGGGLYPIWLLDRPWLLNGELDAAKALAKDWQRVIEHAAAKHGWRYGRGVGDLARVLRIPGTINRKQGLARPCRIIDAAPLRYTVAELQNALSVAMAAITPPDVAERERVFLGAPTPTPRGEGELLVGDDFNARGWPWPDILEPAGWRPHYTQDDISYYTRPGKPSGISASVNGVGTDRLHVFTTSAPPFEAQQSYSKFAAVTVLLYGGDFRKATRELAKAGFGRSRDYTAELAAQNQANVEALLGHPVDPPPAPTLTSLFDTTIPSTPAPAARPAAAGGGKYFTDTGAFLAATLAGDITKLGPLAVGADDIMWSYRGGVWSPDRYVARDRATQLLGERYRRHHAGNVEDIVRASSTTITCDPVSDLINFRNGLLDWATGELRPHTPDVPTTVQLTVDWTPQATCPRFDEFLAEVVPTDMVSVVWELIGYLMFSGNPLHKAVMLMGSGRNGKGTLLRAIVGILGKRNVTAASLHDLVSTRFTTATLFGKLANIAGDIDATYLESTAVFKAITGQDQISAEHKGRDRFDFTPWAVPVFSANEIPPSADTTVGYLSRWLTIPFPADFTGREDRTLDGKLQQESPGIAAKAIPALRALLQRGDFERPESGQQAFNEFVRRVDQVRSWIGDCCTFTPGPHEANAHQFVVRNELYQAYRNWCVRDGHRPLQASKFYDRLSAAGATAVKIGGARGYRGIEVIDRSSMLDATPAPAPGFADWASR